MWMMKTLMKITGILAGCFVILILFDYPKMGVLLTSLRLLLLLAVIILFWGVGAIFGQIFSRNN